MLRLVYRAYGGQNLKNRPPFFSKKLSLTSFLRAALEVGDDAEIVFVNDGPMPEDILEIMRPHGRVIQLPGVGMRRSYDFGLRLPQLFDWGGDDIVWYSEDDYLYRPQAFTTLLAGAERIPDADYFALYGGTSPDPDEEERKRLPRHWSTPPPVTVDGVTWYRILSTASTFGGRATALREDYGIFRLCMMPHRTMYRDHDTAVTIQGFEPHKYPDLLRRLVGAGGGSITERVRQAWITPFLLATNLRSHRLPENRRLFVFSYPSMALHMEIGQFAPFVDWDEVAADAQDWSAKMEAELAGRSVGKADDPSPDDLDAPPAPSAPRHADS